MLSRSNFARQRGLALLLALMIVVIATTIAVSIIYEEKFTIRKTGHIYLMDRASLMVIGMENVARVYLKEDREESETDSLDEYWAQGIPGIPVDGGYFTGYFVDEQARFNLNMLVLSDVELNRFERLCDNLGVEDSFIPALMDWIDEDFDIRYPDGMEENYDSYRVANREMADISELMLVHNVTPEIYEKLEPYITALPTPTTLNVNTMSEVLFKSLGGDGDITRFVEERDDSVYSSIDDFIERLQLPVETEGLGVSTKYFRAHGQVVQGDQVVNLKSLIHRDERGKTIVLNRTLGQI